MGMRGMRGVGVGLVFLEEEMGVDGRIDSGVGISRDEWSFVR